MKKKNKPSKFKNKIIIVDGIKFRSIAESLYYKHLKKLKLIEVVSHFTLQPKFILQPGFEIRGETIPKVTYIADFLVTDNKGNERVIDVKGFPTPLAKLKRVLFLNQYPALPLHWIQLKNHRWKTMDGELFEL